MQQEIRLLACFMYSERTGLILPSVQKTEDPSVFKGLLHHVLSTTLPPPQQGIHLRSGILVSYFWMAHINKLIKAEGTTCSSH